MKREDTTQPEEPRFISNDTGSALLGFLVVGIVGAVLGTINEFTASDWSAVIPWIAGAIAFIIAILAIWKWRITLGIGTLLVIGVVILAVVIWAFGVVF